MVVVVAVRSGTSARHAQLPEETLLVPQQQHDLILLLQFHPRQQLGAQALARQLLRRHIEVALQQVELRLLLATLLFPRSV